MKSIKKVFHLSFSALLLILCVRNISIIFIDWLPTGIPDFWVYVHAGQSVLAGKNPFPPSPANSIVMDGKAVVLLFFNPVPAVLPFLLFAPLPHDLAQIIWMLFNVAGLVTLAQVSARLANLRIKLWLWPFLLYACSQIDDSALINGQPTILIGATLGIVLISRRYGIILPFILIKPHLTLLVFGILLWRIPAIRKPALVSLIACILLTFALRPTWLAEYITSLNNQPTSFGVWNITAFPAWCSGVLGITGVFEYALYCVLLCAGGWILWQFRNADTNILLAAALAVTFLCVPYSRAYDWPLLTLPMLLVVFRLRHRPLWLVVGGITLQLLYWIAQYSEHSVIFAIGWPTSALISLTFLALFASERRSQKSKNLFKLYIRDFTITHCKLNQRQIRT